MHGAELLRPPVNQCPSQVMTQQHQSSPNQKNILDNEAVNATQLRQKAQGDDAGACHHQGACCTHCRPEKSGNQGQKGDIFHHAECVAEPLNAESRIQRTEQCGSRW